MRRTSIRAAALAAGLCLTVPLVASAATVTVVNNDGAGEGFNDTTSVAPVGGNTGTTRGAQRLIAFQFAANIWGSAISSAVEIRVGATFDPLFCDSSSATLGQAGPHTFFRDFAGAPLASTWYPVALANALAGVDLDPTNDDIDAQFNSVYGAGCAFASSFYYGLDGNPPGGTTDFVAVILHELNHGLGFGTIVDLTTGAKALGFDDVFMLNLEDHSTGKTWDIMTNAERVTSSTDHGDLHWVGANVVANSGFLTAGRHTSGHVQMYAPTSLNASSVSHFDTALTPNEIMEPFYTGPHDPSLGFYVLADIGWTVGTPPTITSYNHPSAAKAFSVSFVKAFNQCTAGTFTHNAPITGSGCTPTTPALAGRFGVKGSGKASGAVKVNSLKQATDVILKTSFGDVRTAANALYHGNLLVSGTIRITDDDCVGTPSGGCTVAEYPFPVIVPCGTVASPPLAAGKCKKNTSANGAIPGSVVPNKRANVEIQQLQVYMGTVLTFVEGMYLP